MPIVSPRLDIVNAAFAALIYDSQSSIQCIARLKIITTNAFIGQIEPIEFNAKKWIECKHTEKSASEALIKFSFSHSFAGKIGRVEIIENKN